MPVGMERSEHSSRVDQEGGSWQSSQCPQSKDLAVKWKNKPHSPVQTKYLLAGQQAGGTAMGWGEMLQQGGRDTRRGARGRDEAHEGLKVSFPPSIRCVPILLAMCLKSFLLSPENIYSTCR